MDLQFTRGILFLSPLIWFQASTKRCRRGKSSLVTMLIKLKSAKSRVSWSLFSLADKIPMLCSLLKSSGFSFFLCTLVASTSSACLAKHELCRSVEHANNLFFCRSWIRQSALRFVRCTCVSGALQMKQSMWSLSPCFQGRC